MPTSISRQSLLVLPDPGYHTPKISLQMDTELARGLAHAANILAECVAALRAVANRKTIGDEFDARKLVAAALAKAEMENDPSSPKPPTATVDRKGDNR